MIFIAAFVVMFLAECIVLMVFGRRVTLVAMNCVLCVLLVVLILVGTVADGQPTSAYRVCFDRRTGAHVWTTDVAAQCDDEWRLTAYACDRVRGLPHCNPPALFTNADAPFPFDTPVRFGGEAKRDGAIVWQWIKAANGRACTASEAKMPGYARACNVPVGEVLYYTPKFWSAQ